MSKKFLLDANAFIEPRDRYYAWDICPGYWTALARLHKDGRTFSIDRIRDELIPKNKENWDDIALWISQDLPDTFFRKTRDQSVIDTFSAMVRWVFEEPQYTDAAKAEFASVADGWLVAYAAANNLVVVTHEAYNPNTLSRIKIPNVCEKFGVEYVNTFEMLRTCGAKFIQSTKRHR